MSRRTLRLGHRNVSAFLVVGLVVLGVLAASIPYFLSVIYPVSEDYRTWPKIRSVYIGEVGYFCKYDYKLDVLKYVKKAVQSRIQEGWELQPKPSVASCYEHDPYSGIGMWRITPTSKAVSVWEFKSALEHSYFRIDPDMENDGAPDILVTVKPTGEARHGNYRAAFYTVEIAIIGTGVREMTKHYKRSYVEIVFDSYYLIREITVDGKKAELWLDDESGKTKIIVTVPSVVPERSVKDWVDPIKYMLNLPTDAAYVSSEFDVDLIYDPNIRVHTAVQTYSYEFPTVTPTAYATTGTGTVPPLMTRTTTRTVVQPVTTTWTVTEYVRIFETVSYGRTVTVTTPHTVVVTYTYTGLRPTTVTTVVDRPGRTETIIVEKTVTVSEAYEIKEITEKIVREMPLWAWVLIGVFAVMLAASLAINFSKPRHFSSRRKRRRSAASG